MYTSLVVLILIVCFVLSMVVLAQEPKGGGLSGQFSAGGAASMMGVKRTGDLLEKLTWICAITLVLLSLGTHMLSQGTADTTRSVNQQRALETKLPTSTAPAMPTPGAAAPGGPTQPAPAPQPAK